MIQESLSWVGQTIDNYYVESQLADGAFSWIYQAREHESDRPRILKVAKPKELVHQGGSDIFCTQALAVTDGGTKLVRPDANQLLTSQQSNLYPRLDSGLVRVGKMQNHSALSYYSMEYLGEINLRQQLATGKVEMSIFIDLACQLADIKNPRSFQYHGDLKPENIMVTMDGIKAIDPGYFGAIDCVEGELLEVAVTTPSYYPFLKADDLFAFGLIFWEAVLRQHPLHSVSTAREPIGGIGASMREWIDSQPTATRDLMSGLLHLQRPSEIQPEIAPLLEQVLLKGLRLQIDQSNKIAVGPGFESFAEWFQTLIALSRETPIV